MKDSKIGNFFTIFGRNKAKKNNFKIQPCLHPLCNNKFYQIWGQKKLPRLMGSLLKPVRRLMILLYFSVLATEDRRFRRRPFEPSSWKKFTFPETNTTAICGWEGELTAGFDIVHCLCLFLLYTKDTTSPFSYFPSPPTDGGSVGTRQSKLFSWRRPDMSFSKYSIFSGLD